MIFQWLFQSHSRQLSSFINVDKINAYFIVIRIKFQHLRTNYKKISSEVNNLTYTNINLFITTYIFYNINSVYLVNVESQPKRDKATLPIEYTRS